MRADFFGLADRIQCVDASGIRKVFDLAAKLDDPVNLSIGQPDYPVPPEVQQKAIEAILDNRNAYTQTQGDEVLRNAISKQLSQEFPQTLGRDGKGELCDGIDLLVTSGVSGALFLLFMSAVNPGDEVIIPDPYFVMYKHLVKVFGGVPVCCDTYPDFRLTAERVAPLMTERTKLVLVCSPSNPTGVVSSQQELDDLATLCREHNAYLVSDEIYDRFYSGEGKAPSPLNNADDVILLRGFSKTWAMTGWRVGYMVGPKQIIQACAKLQQYSFVCAPAPFQWAAVTALETSVDNHVEDYARKRQIAKERLTPHYKISDAQGAFYLFVEVPQHLGLTATEFVERAIREHQLLLIPGNVFSEQDTHFRMSFACDDATLERGLDILCKMAMA